MFEKSEFMKFILMPACENYRFVTTLYSSTFVPGNSCLKTMFQNLAPHLRRKV